MYGTILPDNTEAKKLGQFFLQHVKEREVIMKDIFRSIWNVSVMLLYSFQ